jgi:hypothetical protein
LSKQIIDIDPNRPAKRDPVQAAFWETFYQANNRPWQVEGTPQRLQEHLEWMSERWRAARVLIPGCGFPNELQAINAAAKDVLAIDFSVTAVQQAKAAFPSVAHKIHCVDFFDFDLQALLPELTAPIIDVVYERAFLCALPPRARAAYALRMSQLVRPQGVLIGYFYLRADGEVKGPPYSASFRQLQALLGPSFRCELDVSGKEDHPVFRDHSRFMLWRRRSAE